MAHDCEKKCYCDKNCCDKGCCEKSCCGRGCCDKKCKICKFVGYVVCTALISFAVVKLTAPCVVHDAFAKKIGERQLHKMMKFASMDPKMMHHFGHHFDPMMPFPPKGSKPMGPMDKPMK